MAKKNIMTHAKEKRARSLFEENKFVEARELYEQICIRDKRNMNARYYLGATCGQLGVYDEAVKHFSLVIKNNPDLPDVHANLGAALYQLGQKDEALSALRKAVQLGPDNFSAHYNLGKVLFEIGDHDLAIESYQSALRVNPNSAATHNNLGLALLAQRRFEESTSSSKKAIAINPNWSSPYINLAKAYVFLARYEEATLNFERAQKLDGDNAEVHYEFGCLQQILSQYVEAQDKFQKCINLEPNHIKANQGLGNVLLRQTLPDQAEAAFLHVLEISPDYPDAINGLARINVGKRNYQAAYDLLAPLIKPAVKTIDAVFLFARISTQLGCQSEAKELLESLLDHPAVGLEDRQTMLFLLGSISDDMQDYDQAFHRYKQANEMKLPEFSTELMMNTFDEIISAFPKNSISSFHRAENRSLKPVFIIGMPRSGTSLVEQILSSHDDIYGAGELYDMTNIANTLPERIGRPIYPKCVSAITEEELERLAQFYLGSIDKISAGQARVTDKLPHNFLFIGLIRMMFPAAKIIHCIRNPVDTCLSLYFQHFGALHPYSGNLVHLGQYYRQYERLMAHWRDVVEIPMLEVSYEQLVSNQEKVSRDMVDFCELPWDAQCMQFHKNKRVVETASSEQVKKQLYNSSVERWLNYETHLEPLIDILSPK